MEFAQLEQLKSMFAIANIAARNHQSRTFPLFRGKLEHGGALKRLVRAQHDRREVGMVNGIREMLGFQAERRVVRTEANAACSDDVVEVVPGVKLDTRLGR